MIRISYTKLSNTNLDTLAARTVEYSERLGVEAISSSPLLVELKERAGEYNSVVLKNIYSGMGKSVEEADLKRDRIYQSVKRLLQGMAGFSESARGKAAIALLKTFDECGTITDLSYGDENSVLEKLISLLGSDANKAHIATLAIEPEIGEMVKAQTDFKNVFLDQIGANADLRKLDSATNIRYKLENALRDYFAFVSAMRKVAPWNNLYDALNELAKAARLSNLSDKGDSKETPESDAK